MSDPNYNDCENPDRPQWQRDAMRKELGPFFLGIPDRWMTRRGGPLWRCNNGHVSSMYVKSEDSQDYCMACKHPVHITFPEDNE